MDRPQRQGSNATFSSSDSEPTVRGSFESKSKGVFTPERRLTDDEAQISPTSHPRKPAAAAAAAGAGGASSSSSSSFFADSIAPWEHQAHPSHSAAKSSSSRDASSQPSASSAHNWPLYSSASSTGARAMSTQAFGDYLSTHADSHSAHSWDHRSRSGSLREHSPESHSLADDRRPSIASNSTISSNESSRSRTQAMHRKLQGFFGENLPVDQILQAPAPPSAQPTEDVTTPDPSRPRTPQPSSEVTPWLFQDPEDISQFGDAPVREDIQRHPLDRKQTGASTRTMSSSHRIPFRHRHNTSTEQPSASSSQLDLVPSLTMTRNDFNRSTSTLTPRITHALPTNGRQTSISGQSDGSGEGRNGSSKADSSSNPKRFLDRFRRHKVDNSSTTGLTRNLTNISSQQPARSTLDLHQVQSARQGNGDDAVSPNMGKGANRPSLPHQASKRDHHPRLPFKGKRGASQVEPQPPTTSKDPNSAGPSANANHALWYFDTDLSHMEGIVSTDKGQPPSRGDGSQPIWPEEPEPDLPSAGDVAGVWDAPDSWAVKRAGEENVGKLREVDDRGVPLRDDDYGTPFHIRIFRPDSTFTTLHLSLSTTAAEIIEKLGKRSFLTDESSVCHIIMRKHDVSRQLDPGERPIALQKKLLEQAGYTDSDRIDEIGAEDHTYLCRFNFMPAKMMSYSSFEKEPGFNKMQKFSNIDLRGKNLITIPIALYQKSSEIVYLDLSKNISLDVPKDFVQGCTSLRQIQYTSNEAWKVPQSFTLASKLNLLNLSNNLLENLVPAELHRLESLASLQLANNKLSSLPPAFAQFRSLRTLNLSSNSLTELPMCVCQIKTLVELDISFNSIASLPNIGCLENLERLWCTNNKLSGKAEDTVTTLNSLREIDCRFNNMSNLDALSRLPQLENMFAGHNSITTFDGSFTKIRTLYLDHNPITQFSLATQCATLTTLSLASAKLASLPEDLFAKCTGLNRLILNKNHLTNLSPQIGRLQKLEFLSLAKNSLSALPVEIGRLFDLRFLDVRENNINSLPSELWFCRRLETLNMSSNVLDRFPKAPTPASLASLEQSLSSSSLGSLSSGAPTSPISEEGGDGRRASQTPSYISSGGTPPMSNSAGYRKASVASQYGLGSRKPSMLSRTSTETTLNNISPVSRKDSISLNRITATMAGSLRNLLLADNRLTEDIFDEITALQELRVVNLSYNELFDVPHRAIRRWSNLTELYLSGNDLSSLPTEDFEDISGLRILHINNNKFQVLPAELGKARMLAVLDAGSNSLKYNVSNWPYDWNWNCNPHLKYLNLSGNKRLEIKPANTNSARDEQNLTDFGSLVNLRVLGLMDVTLMIPSVPDESDDRRVRTSGSQVGTMAYGIADCLGKSDHLSTVDIVIPKLAHDDEMLVGMFDGAQQSNSGSKVAKFLQENFREEFEEQLQRKAPSETPADALRRTYLALNKELATWANQSHELKERRSVHRGSMVSQTINKDDVNSGCVATVMFIHGMDLYVSNVGDAEAVLIQSEGSHRKITEKHDPAEAKERARIREAGGFVSKQGKLNDELALSRAFGYIHLTPALIAAPFVQKLTISESDEMILLASKELWDYLTPDYAVDIARSERGDLMRAAQKLRDLAIAFGASGKITVMLLGVDGLRKKERAKYRSHSMSMGPSGLPDEYMVSRSKKRRGDPTLDSKLARLDQEVEAPVGEVSLVFTDIKNSTLMWETYQTAMRSAIKMHNDVMRRHLRLIGGYEVKTEGDAFIVAFPTVTSALLWCFTIQNSLLEVPWPQEILTSVHGQEVTDNDGNRLFRGLSVRMGIHCGVPVCETDPVTRRMDYFGPMVNRTARISAEADGGQITVSSDFIAEVQRLLETYMETDRSNSTGSEEQINDDAQSASIRRELRSLSSHGFEVKDLGERRLKGLENPEHIYLMYPHALSGRLSVQQQRADAAKALSTEGASSKEPHSQLTIDLDNVWDLWKISLRLEMLCSTLENRQHSQLKPPETALLERTKERGGEVTDRFLLHFVEHQVSRIETCVTSLAVRNLVRPFQSCGPDACGPMSDILAELSDQLAELRALKEQIDIDIAPS